MNQSRVVPAAAALAWMVFAACSVTPSRPPDLGPCDTDAAACGASAVSGGGTSGAEDGGMSPSACQVSAADSQCTQCASSSCCPSFNACTQSPDCENLLRCEQSCAGAAGCAGDCESTSSPDGVGLLNTLTACIGAKCPVCSQSGVGDPCVAQANTCNPGLSCSGLWCTKACARSADCEGLGAGGGNALGLPNACMLTTAAGRQCAPGCQTDADCGSFPGSFCFATTSADGLSVQVCTPPPDAGAD